MTELLNKRSMHHIEKEDSLARGIREILGAERRSHWVTQLSVRHLVWGLAGLAGVLTLGFLLRRTTVSVSGRSLSLLLTFGAGAAGAGRTVAPAAAKAAPPVAAPARAAPAVTAPVVSAPVVAAAPVTKR